MLGEVGAQHRAKPRLVSAGENNGSVGSGGAHNRHREAHDLDHSPGTLSRKSLLGGEDELTRALRSHMNANAHLVLHGIDTLPAGGEDIDEPGDREGRAALLCAMCGLRHKNPFVPVRRPSGGVARRTGPSRPR